MDTSLTPASRWSERRAGIALYAAYLRLLKLSRLLAVGFWTMMAFFLFWSVPWLPGGLAEEDYNRRVAFTLILGGLAFGMGVGVLTLRDRLRRLEESLMAFNAVYDNATGLFNRRYFYDRLALECERARRRGTLFSVLLFRIDRTAPSGRRGGGDAPDKTLRLLSDELLRRTRGPDVVAILGGNELAVAAPGVDKGAASQLGQRLRAAVEEVLAPRSSTPSTGAGDGPPPTVRLGVSGYPDDGTNAASLIRLARESMAKAEPADTPEPRERDVA